MKQTELVHYIPYCTCEKLRSASANSAASSFQVPSCPHRTKKHKEFCILYTVLSNALETFADPRLLYPRRQGEAGKPL